MKVIAVVCVTAKGSVIAQGTVTTELHQAICAILIFELHYWSAINCAFILLRM